MKRLLTIGFILSTLFIPDHAAAQCEVSGVSKSVVEFYSTTENVAYIQLYGLDLSDDCVYSFEYDHAPFLNVQQVSGYEIKITGSSLDYFNFTEQVVTINSDGNPSYPQKVTVRVRIGGKIGSATNSVKAGESPGTFSNVSAAPNAEAYQWQKSVTEGQWTDISGATGLTYTCPVLSESTKFRRKATKIVNNEMMIAYSNTLDIVIDISDVVSSEPGNFKISQDENYIITKTPQVAVRDQPTLAGLPFSQQRASVSYFDGLERPKKLLPVLSEQNQTCSKKICLNLLLKVS